MTPHEFIARWKVSQGAEIANSQGFLKELCTVLDVPQHDVGIADEERNVYTFEKAVKLNNNDGTTSDGRVDLYKRGCFVLESKQGVERRDVEQAEVLATKNRQKKRHSGTATRGTPGWGQAMTRAFHQAKRYAAAIPN